MACHELAALRLGLMKILNIDDPAEKDHERKELGTAADVDGPIKSLSEAEDLDKLKRFFSIALVELQERVSKTTADSPQMPYFQSLILVTKKVEQELQMHYDNLKRLYDDLDDIHHFIHEVFPAKN